MGIQTFLAFASFFNFQFIYIFQEFRLLSHLSAFDNVALPLRVAGTKRGDVNKHVAELLTWVGLKDHMKARPPTLSGGQQQRVAIARAVISRPRLLLADEPTGNVDDDMGYRLIHLFEELNRLGTTVVIATHNQHLVERLGNARLSLAAGRLAVVPGVARDLKAPNSATDSSSRSPDEPSRPDDAAYRSTPGVENFL